MVHALWRSVALSSLVLASTSVAVPFPPLDLTPVIWNETPQGDGVEIEVRIPRPGVREDDDGFHSASVPGLFPLHEAGRPDLPSTGKLLALTDGEVPTAEMRYASIGKATGFYARAFQVQCRCSTPPQAFQWDSSIYSSGQNFPNAWVAFQEAGRVQGVRLVRVAVKPVRTNLTQKSLEWLRESQIRIHVKPAKIYGPRVRLASSIHRALRALVANPAHFDAIAEPQAGPERIWVFTADALEGTLAPWIAWKKSRGYQVDVHSLARAGGTRETALTYLSGLYKAAVEKPDYLLLVGAKTLPGFLEKTYYGTAISDWRYALLEDPNDALPDVAFGRIVADTASDASLQLTRAIEYERNPAPGDWTSSAVTIASDEGFDPSDRIYAENVASALHQSGYTRLEAFLQADQTATVSNLQRAFDRGQSWITYFGHGLATKWISTSPDFTLDSIDGLKNGKQLPFLVDVSCRNGDWWNHDRCFGKAWVSPLQMSGGAVGYYGTAVDVSWLPPALLAIGIARMASADVPSLGALTFAGQLFVVGQMGRNQDTEDNLKWFSLFGDPTLRINGPAFLRSKSTYNSFR